VNPGSPVRTRHVEQEARVDRILERRPECSERPPVIALGVGAWPASDR
jgi:hypothetical protein